MGVSLGTAALVTVTAALASPARAAATDTQQAEAIAKPSVVFVETHWKGYLTRGSYAGVDVADLLTDRNDHLLPLKVITTCSGFVANEEGYVVTAGHCVDDATMRDGGKGLLVDRAVDMVARLVEKSGNPLSSSTLEDMRQTGYANWTIEGDDGGSAPERVVRVYPTEAAFGTSASSALTANVVSVRPFKKGDIALLKVTTDNPWPALELAPEGTSTSGTPVVAAGYPGAVTSTVDAGAEASMNDGTISGRRTVNGVPFTQISPAIGPGMSGGPVLNAQGQVLGTVSWTTSEQSQHFNFMTDTSTVRSILATNDVGTTLSSTDRAYRKGLDEYFARKYREAAKDFEQVLTLEPNHAQAQNFHRLAVLKSPEEPLPVVPKPKPSGTSPLLVAAIAAGVLVVIGAIAVLLVVGRRRRRKAPVAPWTADGRVPAEDGVPAAPVGGEPTAAHLDASLDTLAVPQETVAFGAMTRDDEIPREETPGDEAGDAQASPGAVPGQRPTAEGASLSPQAEPSPGSLHLFVTYAREDRALVDRLRVGLQRLRHEVWIDDRLVVGDAWWDVILRQIRNSDAVLVAVSPALLQSQASALEQEYARRLGKVILPVSVRPVRPELMPPELASLQMVDYSDPDVSAAFELADALAHLPPSPELPDPLPEPPPVPLSYLSDLTARVRAPSLTLDEQLALVARLRSALGKTTEHQPALELLRTLQGREDLYIGPAREIDTILANQDVKLPGGSDALTKGQATETTPGPS